MRDKLRELMFPALVLSIVGSLWALGYATEAEEDVYRGIPPSPGLARIIREAQKHGGYDDDGPSAAVDFQR